MMALTSLEISLSDFSAAALQCAGLGREARTQCCEGTEQTMCSEEATGQYRVILRRYDPESGQAGGASMRACNTEPVSGAGRDIRTRGAPLGAPARCRTPFSEGEKSGDARRSDRSGKKRC